MNTIRTEAFGSRQLSHLDWILFHIRAHKLRSALPDPVHTAVDLGAGYRAALLRQLLKQGLIERGHAVDVSVDPEIAEKRISIQQMDLNSGVVSLPDGTADFVVSLAVIEHLTDPEHFVREAYRLLKSGGRFFLTTPSPLAKPILEFMAYRLKIISEAEIRDHKHYFTEQELEMLLTECGFREAHASRFQLNVNTALVGVK